MTTTTTQPVDKNEVARLIDKWNRDNDGSKYRDKLRSMALASGFKCPSEPDREDLGRFVTSLNGVGESIVVDGSEHPIVGAFELPKPLLDQINAFGPDQGDWITKLARECVRLRYLGQTMKQPENAAKYIKMAARVEYVESDLPETGILFWKAVKYHFDLWRVERGL